MLFFSIWLIRATVRLHPCRMDRMRKTTGNKESAAEVQTITINHLPIPTVHYRIEVTTKSTLEIQHYTAAVHLLT